MIKEEIIGKLIKDAAFAEYLIKSNLSEYDMAKLVCHAPISLFEKQSLYKNLLGKKNYGNVNGESENFYDRFSYENYLRIVTKAIDDLNLPKDGTFLLVGHSFDNGYDEQFGCAPFRSYRAVQDYLKETFSEGGEENNDRFTGGFYNEVMHDYVDLEYYRSDFNGGERVLLPIKHFLGGDIDEETFAKSCEIIKKQEEVKEEIRYLNMTDEWKEKLRIKEK